MTTDEECLRQRIGALQAQLDLLTSSLNREKIVRLHKKIEELQVQWDLLTKQLFLLNRARILTKDPEEKMGYECRIEEKEAEREQLEKQLEEKEAEREQLEKQLREKETKREQLEKQLEESERKLFEIKLEEETSIIHKKGNPKPGYGDFEFTVITVNQRGEIIKRDYGKTHQYIEDLGNNVLLEMVAIPGGKFWMGSPETEKGWFASEHPQREVMITPFYMAKYPITQEQWETVATLPQIKLPLTPDPARSRGIRRPVEQIKWDESIEFCERLSRKTGHTYRLPSEAEWEYACRAGTITPFHFGATIAGDLASYDCTTVYDSESTRKPYANPTFVCSFRVANSFGLYDMHGNVYEWCADPWHDNYIGAPSIGSIWESDGDSSQRVLRGGSWIESAKNCRCAYRRAISPYLKFDDVGFRVACDEFFHK